MNALKKSESHGLVIHSCMAMMAMLLFSCSTTRNLPADEKLYTGIERIEYVNDSSLQMDETVKAEVKAVLAFPPNNAILGSSSLRFPFPFGLWIYNAFVNHEKGLGRWLFNRFATEPVFISTVNPSLRSKVAANLLHDEGFFRGRVTSQVVPQDNPRKEKVIYLVDAGPQFVYDSIEYLGFSGLQDTLVRLQHGNNGLLVGKPFKLSLLEEERKQMAVSFRNNGFHYFRNDYIYFKADTVRKKGKVWLQVCRKDNLPMQANRRWYIGEVTVDMKENDCPSVEDSLQVRYLKLRYSGKKPPLRPRVWFQNLKFKLGDISSEEKQRQSRENLIRTGVFSSVDMQFSPSGRTWDSDTLDVFVHAVLAKPLDVELEGNVTSKSNGLTGPGVSLALSRKNIFRGGEKLSIKLDVSYEWQIGGSHTGGGESINSWELGFTSTLDFPRLVLPVKNKYTRFPVHTAFKLYAGRLNRAGFFKMLSFGGSAVYTIQPTRLSKHVFTPFRLNFYMLQEHTQKFDSIMQQNPALAISFQDQFIPAMNYTYTFDDASVASRRHHTCWNLSVTSAGGLASAVYALFGKSFNKTGKSLFGNPFAQFLKVTTELRNLFKISGRTMVATRFFAGVVIPYGNSRFAPYSEQFYVGGANSLRAFSARRIGPGSFHPSDEKYAYLDETGDVRLEANAEIRFPLLGNLYGAFFIDAGNVWLLRSTDNRRGGVLTWRDFGKEIALCTGVGLRYDLNYLILRMDVGMGIHLPYDTGKSGYYNIPSFKDGLGLHLAVGYPF